MLQRRHKSSLLAFFKFRRRYAGCLARQSFCLACRMTPRGTSSKARPQTRNCRTLRSRVPHRIHTEIQAPIHPIPPSQKCAFWGLTHALLLALHALQALSHPQTRCSCGADPTMTVVRKVRSWADATAVCSHACLIVRARGWVDPSSRHNPDPDTRRCTVTSRLSACVMRGLADATSVHVALQSRSCMICRDRCRHPWMLHVWAP